MVHTTYALRPDVDFRLTPEDELFRDEVRAFVRREVPPHRTGVVTTMEDFAERDDPFIIGLRRKLAQRGWLTMGWPREYGGQGASPLRQTVFLEELAYHDAPGQDLMGVGIVGPTIMRYGTEEQKRRHLQAIARGEAMWVQGFSEPSAGSDLGGLSTRADLQGDQFIINGQKIWSSGAHIADWMFLLARTDQQAPKHRGISAILLDMREAKGMTVRPIVNMAGMQGFNEVFFDNTAAPRANLLGEMNRGFYYAMDLLEAERISFINYSAIGRGVLDALGEYMRDTAHGRGAEHGRWTAGLERTLARHRLAEHAIEMQTARRLSYLVSWMASVGQPAGHHASINKLFSTEAFRRLAVTAMQIAGQYGQVEGESRHAPLMGRINRIYYFSVGMQIAGGTSEIQRNVIASRGLGLPR